MARDWETWLQRAVRGPSETEKEEHDRTVARIRAAIEADSNLAGRTHVFVKGSYANNTNVRADADVDIGVEWTEWAYVLRAFRAKGLSPEEVGFTPTDEGPSPATYRLWVRDALEERFGSEPIYPGNKAILVEGSTSTLDADVVPCFPHHRYDDPGESPKEGIRLFPRSGDFIINWPEQNLENGREKNRETNRRYKRIVRATKRLEGDMVERGLLSKEVPSYLIECLLWNVENFAFTSSDSLLETMRSCLGDLWQDLREKNCGEWGEVNELKYLFRNSQPWTEAEALAFVDKAWDYIGVG
jgi:hypothetical protein